MKLIEYSHYGQKLLAVSIRLSDGTEAFLSESGYVKAIDGGRLSKEQFFEFNRELGTQLTSRLWILNNEARHDPRHPAAWVVRMFATAEETPE